MRSSVRRGFLVVLLIAIASWLQGEAYCDVNSDGVQFTSPSDRQWVTAPITVSAIKRSDAAWVNFYLDGKFLQSSPPTSFNYDPSSLSVGLHTISGTAFKSSGQTIGSASVRILVNTPVTITSPSNNARVSGQVSVTALTSPDVIWANMYVDGTYQSSSPPYTFTWDTTKVAVAGHTITIKAFNHSGALGSSQALLFANTPLDVTNPANGATVSGNVQIVTRASSQSQWVNVLVDNQHLGSSPPYSFIWNSDSAACGIHTIVATANTSAGGQIGSVTLSVNVQRTAKQYFVDPAGNDSNSGTSPNSAWQTIAKVNSYSSLFAPGDTIEFKSGGTWRETLTPARGGTPGQPITFTAYGPGFQPVISGSDVVSGWSSYVGPIYQASENTWPNNVFVDGAPPWGLSHVSSLAAMTPGTFVWSSGVLYVWLPDGSNPAYHTMEAANRLYGFYVNDGDGSHSNITVSNLNVQRVAGWGICIHAYAGPGLTGITISHNTVSQTGTGQIDTGQYYNGIQMEQEPTLPTAPVISQNTVLYSGGHGNGIQIQGAGNAQIVGNDVSAYNHNGIDVKNSDGDIVQGNTVHDQAPFGAAFYCEYATNVLFEQNIAKSVYNAFQIALSSTGSILNNSIYNTDTGVFFGPTGSTVKIENNAMNASVFAVSTDGYGTITEDFNDWGIGSVFTIGNTWYSLSQWKVLGSHAHDLAVDPMWTNPPNGLFTLLPTSPCINSGTAVGLPYTGSAPDMGAIESSY